MRVLDIFIGRIYWGSDTQPVEQEGGSGQWRDSDYALTAGNRSLPSLSYQFTDTL